MLKLLWMKLNSLREEHQIEYSMEGYQSARWILMDYGDVVVHIFTRTK